MMEHSDFNLSCSWVTLSRSFSARISLWVGFGRDWGEFKELFRQEEYIELFKDGPWDIIRCFSKS
jgi:hypothetical protein